MTFTLGRWVARIRWIPMARAFCASIANGVSTSACTVIIRSASSSTTSTMYGKLPSVYCSGVSGSGGVSGSSAEMVVSVSAGRGGFLSGLPSATFRLKSPTLRAPLA